MTTQAVLIGDTWRAADSAGTFQAYNPVTKEALATEFAGHPVAARAQALLEAKKKRKKK